MDASDLSIKVSVIIPTKNEEHVIYECLSAVFNQTLKPLEVIIIDGRSTDDTLVEARRFPVNIITETEPTSLPHARNLGIENANGDIIFIIDADVILDRDCIKNAVKYFEDSNVIAVIPSEQNVTHSHLEKIQNEWIRGTANPIRSGIGISVFAEFLRKTVFEKVEFDSNLGYGEDGDFQKRLRGLYSKSGKIIYARDSMISVHYDHTLRELRIHFAWYGRTFARYLLKDFSIKSLLNLGSLLAPTILLILCFLTIFVVQALPFLVLFFALLVARNLIACYRSRTIYFVEFMAFEFIRSLFFVIGIFQGFFSNRRGK